MFSSHRNESVQDLIKHETVSEICVFKQMFPQVPLFGFFGGSVFGNDYFLDEKLHKSFASLKLKDSCLLSKGDFTVYVMIQFK